MTDASILLTLTITNAVEQIVVSPDEAASVFFVDYIGTAGEVYRTADGELLETLPAEIGKITFYQEMPGAFVIEYQDLAEPAELRKIEGDEAPMTLANPEIAQITFSGDKEIFAIYYLDGSADVYRTAEKEPLAQFTEQVRNIRFFPSDMSAPFHTLPGQEEHILTFYGQTGESVTISVTDDTIQRDSWVYLVLYPPGGEVIEEYGSGEVQIQNFRLSDSGSFDVLVYGESPGTYSLSIKGIASVESDDPESAEPHPSTAFIVQFDDGRAEVWDIDKGKPLSPFSPFSNVAAVSFSPDPDGSVFIVEDISGSREVYSTSDGRRLAREATEIIYSLDPEATYFIVTYADSPAEIFHTSTGKLLATLKDEVEGVTFSSDENGTYFVVEYPGDHSEVWLLQDDDPHAVTDLGSNVVNYFFDVPNQRLVVRYEDNHVYLYDLAMLEILNDELSAEDLRQRTCNYLFSPEMFNEAELADNLGENEPVACP
jgi:WD40 repeat protein